VRDFVDDALFDLSESQKFAFLGTGRFRMVVVKIVVNPIRLMVNKLWILEVVE
jgi:hypothetical protein